MGTMKFSKCGNEYTMGQLECGQCSNDQAREVEVAQIVAIPEGRVYYVHAYTYSDPPEAWKFFSMDDALQQFDYCESQPKYLRVDMHSYRGDK